MSKTILQQVIYLPEWESIPADPDEAIDYLSHWDYGEYHTDPEEVETVYARNGDTYRKGDYLMHRYFDGSHALYRIMKKGAIS